MDKKTMLIWIGVFIVGVAVMQFIGSLMPKPPSYFKATIKRLKKNEILMDSIGGYSGNTFTHNHANDRKDTVNFVVEINGFKRNLHYKGTAIRIGEDNWKISDSTIQIVP